MDTCTNYFTQERLVYQQVFRSYIFPGTHQKEMNVWGDIYLTFMQI